METVGTTSDLPLALLQFLLFRDQSCSLQNAGCVDIKSIEPYDLKSLEIPCEGSELLPLWSITLKETAHFLSDNHIRPI